MAKAGLFLVSGIGVEKNVTCGTSMASVAAGMGSDHACCVLGFWHFDGMSGLPRKKAEAEQWLTKAVDGSCSTKHLSDARKEECRKWLEELEQWP